MVSQVPSPVDRLGIDEKAKITAAHAKTGSHTVRTRDLATAADASLRRQTGERQGNPVQIRNGPAAVRGDAPAPYATGPRAGKAAREGAPSQKTSAAGNPKPLAEGRIRVSPTHRRRGGSRRGAAHRAGSLRRH